MGKYNFDEYVERRNTNCTKWDNLDKTFPRAKKDSIPMWIADMDFAVADPIIESVHRVADRKVFGYSTRETDEFYNAVLGWYKRRFDWELDRKSIMFCGGVVPAVALLIRLLTEEGNGVIIQRPVYYPFTNKIKENNRKVVNNPLIYKNGKYTMNFEDLEEKAADPNNKLMILCSPHNPVGRVWTEEELKKVVEICKKHDVFIIADEIHNDLVRKGHKHINLQKLCPEYKEHIVTCLAASKTFNLAGMQMSNIIINTPELREAWLKEVPKSGAQHNPNPFSIEAVIAAYNESEDWLDELIEYLDSNAKYVEEFVKENLPKVKVTPLEGTYLMWLDFNEYGISADELETIMLEEAGLIFDEGTMFGEEGSGFERINIACPRCILEECMKRIHESFKDR